MFIIPQRRDCSVPVAEMKKEEIINNIQDLEKI